MLAARSGTGFARRITDLLALGFEQVANFPEQYFVGRRLRQSLRSSLFLLLHYSSEKTTPPSAMSSMFPFAANSLNSLSMDTLT